MTKNLEGLMLTDEELGSIWDATATGDARVLTFGREVNRITGARALAQTWAEPAAIQAQAAPAAQGGEARDNCEFCLGHKGGVRGNENRIGGHVVCDYCTPLLTEVIKAAHIKGEGDASATA